MIGIYKITNNLNNKCYIGQSVHIERRFSEHCFPSKKSQISLAIQKYGKENFSFEIIEECSVEKLNEREQFWIKYYNSLSPNGYNITEDTSSTHTNYRFFDKIIIDNIIIDLKDSNLSLKEISDKYQINISNISRINAGITHRREDLTYPIRKTNYSIIQKKYCLDCGKEISSTAIRCSICDGLNRKISLEDMPITREELKNLIRTTSFIQIGKQFKVSDNAIRKWCLKFNLPKTKKEINSYSNKEWELI